MAGRLVPTTWNDRRVEAWVPDRVAGVTRSLTETTRRVTEEALGSLVKVDASLPPGWESLARILLRAEGIASSSVEGIVAPAPAVFAAVEAPTEDLDAAWIADNLAVVTMSLDDTSESVTHDLLCTWHRRLMVHSRLPDHLIGAYRNTPGWIGGTTPTNAVYVAPPADQVPALMDDLLGYLNSNEDDPVTQAAIVHGQFETIHPFGDGNGRIGRILIGWVLTRRARLNELPPPVSVLIARDPGGYLSGLHQFRDGSLDRWVRWFAEVVDRASRATSNTLAELDRIRGHWQAATEDLRADSTTRKLLDVLVESPVLTAVIAADHVGVSARSARTALDQLEQRGVVSRATIDQVRPARGRRPQWWTAHHVVDTVAGWAG